jgi:hypothetical protein
MLCQRIVVITELFWSEAKYNYYVLCGVQTSEVRAPHIAEIYTTDFLLLYEALYCGACLKITPVSINSFKLGGTSYVPPFPF